MEGLVTIVQWTSNLLYLALAVLAIGVWRRQRTPAASWLAASFGTVAVVVAVGLVLEATGREVPPRPLLDLIVWGVLFFAWALLRFVVTQTGTNRWTRTVDGLVLLAAVMTPFTDLSDPEGSGFGSLVYTLVFVLAFGSAAVTAGLRLVRHGPRVASLVRTRARLMGVGALGVALSVVVSASASGSDVGALVASLIGVLAGLLFLAGFATPAPLRAMWRRHDEDRLYVSVARMLTYDDPDSLVATLVPDVLTALGARGIVAVDANGDVTLEHGDVPGLTSRLGEQADTGQVAGLLRVEVPDATLYLNTDVLTPFVGDDEIQFLQRIALLTQLALQRTVLLEREREARADAESAHAQAEASNVELTRANRDLEALTHAASHDLRNPLTTVAAAAQAIDMMEGDQLTERARHLLRRIEANARYMDGLVGQILDLASVGRGESPVDDVDLVDIATTLVAEMADTGAVVHLDAEPIAPVRMNPTHARRLVTNLVVNAHKYAGDGVRVTLREIGRDGNQVVLRLGDDGPGIPADRRRDVFEEFQRASTAAGGFGLGLAICRRVVEHAGGSIDLVDTDVGACFEIRLPRATTRPGRAPADAPRPVEAVDAVASARPGAEATPDVGRTA